MSEGALIATTAKDGRAKFQPRNRDNICFCCRSEENRENLTKCHFKKCPVSFHDSCFDSYRIGGFNPMMMVDRATKARHCSRHYCTFCYGNRLRTRAFFGKKFTCCSQCELAWHEKCIPAGCTLDENGEIICPRHRVFDRVAVHFPHCASCQKTKKEDEKPLPCRSCVRSVHISCMVKGGSITDKEHLVDNDGTITCPWCYDFGFVTENQYCMGYSKSTKLPFAYYPCVPVPNSEYPGRKEPKLGTPGYVAVKWMVWRNTITYNVLPHTKIVEMNEKDYFFINGINHKTCDETLKEPWMEAQQKLGDPMTKLQLRDDQMPTKEQNPESHVKIVNYYVQWDPEKEKLVRATIPSTSKTSKGDKYCDCKGVDGERCGPQSNCYNRECGRECPKDCGKGDDTCLNRVITTGKKCGSDVIEVFDTMICGKGVRAKKLIEPGTFIGEYYGEIISAEEATRRMKRTYMDENQEEKSYIMDIKGRYIDAKEVGGVIRYVNHSCAPNCEIRPIECDGTTRLALFSIQKIKAGQELTFQYGMETITDGVGPLPDCYCGTKECTGVLGYRKEEKSKPKTSKSTTRGRPSLNKKNKPPTLPSSTNILLKEHNSGSCGGRGVGRKRKWTELPPSRENAGLSPATVAESTECPVREGLPIEELQSPI